MFLRASSTMAAGFIDGMNDHRLKPQLLHSLLRSKIPDEKHPAVCPLKLASAVSDIEAHDLLSERCSSDPKLAEAWRAAMDAWVERLLLLVSSNMPDKCWAGVCLLGITCKDCSSDRFLESYSQWFQTLLLNIQTSASRSLFVKAASCASLSDLLTRLAIFPNIKKDASALAGKLVLPIIQLLNDIPSESIMEGAIDLLSTIMMCFPSSVHSHYSRVEAVLASKILSGKSNSNSLKKVAYTLSLLPKIKGDEHSWSSMMQKILIEINMFISDAFRGFEREENGPEFMKLIVPPGKEPPPPLGGEIRSEQAYIVSGLLVPRVSALMHCCSFMLTNPYPIQVSIQVRPLLALIRRIIGMDGSLHLELLPSTTSVHQELVCSIMKDLHLSSLDLLVALIKGMQSQLLPHATNVARLLTDNFQKIKLPHPRIKFYYIMKILLISMGVGIAHYLAQEVKDNTFKDLDDHTRTNSVPNKPYSTNLAKGERIRKRKHSSATSVEQINGGFVEAEAAYENSTISISVKVAALEALEALLTVGGCPERWRTDVDTLVFNVATHACNTRWTREGDPVIFSEESNPSSTTDFQLAALRALLASLLSPSGVGRPPFLSESLELFRRGKRQTGTELSAFCARALLALEVLTHPRTLPLVDFTIPTSTHPSSTFYGGGKSRMALTSTLQSMGGSGVDRDELYDRWLGNDEEAEDGGGGRSPGKAAEDADSPRPLGGFKKDAQAENEAASKGDNPPEGVALVAIDDAVMEDGDTAELEKQGDPKVGAAFDVEGGMAPVSKDDPAPRTISPYDDDDVGSSDKWKLVKSADDMVSDPKEPKGTQIRTGQPSQGVSDDDDDDDDSESDLSLPSIVDEEPDTSDSD